MDKDKDTLNVHANEDSIFGRTLRILNLLESEGLIDKYAIGGAVGVLFYSEPFSTEDLDVFCHIPGSGLLVDLGPLYKHLDSQGYRAKGEHVEIEGVPVQFLVPTTPLVEEALEQAIGVTFENVPTRIFSLEHLLAIMVETGRPRDRAKLAMALDSTTPDEAKLKDILQRYSLTDRWSKWTES